jgi:hypothetical protein
LLLVAALALAVGACDLIAGYGMTDPEDFAPLRPVATWTEGSAGLTVDGGSEIDLGRLTGAGLYEGWYGGEATWSNADGWYVRVYGATTSGGPFGIGGSVVLDRVLEGQHWTTWDSSRCIVTIETADERGLRGTAICKGLRWSDAISVPGGGFEPTYIEDQDPFDVDIRFEALPATTTPA